MASVRSARSGKRAPLRRADIIDAAIALADADGLDAVSMRRVAGALGYEAMSLYNHVANRDEVLEGMVDGVLAGVDRAGGPSWRSEARAIVVAVSDELRRHPWATDLWPRTFPGPNRWRLTERLLTALHASGAGDVEVDVAFHALTNHMVGAAHVASGYAADARGMAAGMRRVADEVSASEFPAFHRHLAFHREDGGGRDGDDATTDAFEFVVDLVLDALDRAAGTGTKKPRSES